MHTVVNDEPRTSDLRVVPAQEAPFADVEAVFGTKGDPAHCWCQWYKIPGSDWRSVGDEGLRDRLAAQLETSDTGPGLLAYDGDTPVGWCALAPREEYGGLARSRILKPVDDEPVWSITCFYVARSHRRRGVTVALLEAAARFVAARGGRWLEGYPAEPASGAWPDAYAYHGTVSAFTKAGFVEVVRPSKTRAIMRRRVRARPGSGQATR